MKRLLAALGITLCAQLALGQHPNDARGFEAGKVYNFNDVDTVSTFNGNLMVHLPIGPAYHVNGALSYQLGLFYNSHCWRFDADSYNAADTIRASPIGSFNAGLGWILSLGRLFDSGDPEIRGGLGGWTYQSSDGADHNFYATVHNGVGVIAPETYYTRDGSYTRLSKVGNLRVVEFGDGTKKEFTQMIRGAGTWSPSGGGHDWLLTGIVDQFGNRVTLTYSSVAPYAEIWTITDGARTTSVYFKPSATPSVSVSTPPSPSDVVLDHIDTQMVGGVSATYGFTTEVREFPWPRGDTDPRDVPTSLTVLTAVTPPTGNPYRMTLDGHPAYDNTPLQQPIPSIGIRGTTPGALTRLTLPTLGSIGWTHDRVQFTPGSQDKTRSPAIEFPIGVTARNTYDASGQLLGTWTYGRRFSQIPIPCLPEPICPVDGNGLPPRDCPSGRSRQLTTWVTEPTVQGGETKTTINYFSNYEYIPTNPDGDTCDTLPEGWSHGEHGLPFTRYASIGGRFLSSEVRTGVNFSGVWNDGRGMMAPPTDGVSKQVRATYVKYQIDDGPYNEDVPFDYNAIPTSTATYSYDDTDDPSNCGSSGTDPCYFTAVNNLGFDTYGHFRQTSTDANLPGTGNNFRTTLTNYNAAPAPSAPWILNTSSEQCTADESSVRTGALSSCNDLPSALITKTQYDANGALTARRTLLSSGGTLATSDLLATFAHDVRGNVTSEQYYGGDTQEVGRSASAPFAPVNNANPPVAINAQYGITYDLTYSGGVVTRDKATYDNSSSLTASDTTYDQWTGLVTEAKDVSGLGTSYEYDLLGRIHSIQPPGVAATIYEYPPASFSNSVFVPAKVSAVTDASSNGIGKISREYQYDLFGRLWRQKSLLPDDTWNIVQTDYDVLGRKKAVSQPETVPVDESSFDPAHKTTYSSFDPFGRARSIQAADLSTTTFAFSGVRSVTKTVSVATSESGSTPVLTTEIHDALGRLYQLTERSGDTSSSSAIGSYTTTTYTYDSGDHLTSVATSGSTQHRSFQYDNRGFLKQEQHPEVGTSGNEFVYYGGYDARGHATSKRIGSANGLWDLGFVYDPAERLTDVYDSGSSLHPVQHYSFLPPNDSSAYGKGRLNHAIRYNYLAGLTTPTVVTETYKYTSPSGRPSERDTLVENVNGSVRTTLASTAQNFTYDLLGAISQLDDPTCSPACGGLALTGPTYTHKNGALTAVSSYAPAITYNPDGSLFEVAHNTSGSVKDTYSQDSSGMSRPGTIKFEGFQSCAASSAIVGGGGTITGPGQTAAITATFSGNGTAPWSITWSDNVTESGIMQNSWTRLVSPADSTTYTLTSATDVSGCPATRGGTATVTVQSCSVSATVSGNANITVGQSTQIQATFTGTSPWNFTWSDGQSYSGITQNPFTRTVTPTTTTTYTITSLGDGAGCHGTSTGSPATVTVASLQAPSWLTATTVTGASLNVNVLWNSVPGAAWYQVEQATRVDLQDWIPIGAHVTGTSLPISFALIATPSTYLYRVRSGITVGGIDYRSTPSAFDYATVAASLFTDDPIQAGLTIIKGVHLSELRHAIDAVRLAAGFTTPAWSSYVPVTGFIFASENLQARQKLDEAVQILLHHNVFYSGETPAVNGTIWGYQYQQIREGVK